MAFVFMLSRVMLAVAALDDTDVVTVTCCVGGPGPTGKSRSCKSRSWLLSRSIAFESMCSNASFQNSLIWKLRRVLIIMFAF